MSVSKADANGAGSVSPPVPAPATTDRVARGKGTSGAGHANGANTTWSTARKQVQVAEASKRSGSLNFKAIDAALDDLTFAELRFVGAYNSYIKDKNVETKAAYEKEKDRYKTAQMDFEMFIENQTNGLAADSSVYPAGHGLKNSAQVRRLEQKILDHASGPQRKRVQEAINQNRGLRAAREARALSAKMQETNGKLNQTQKSEAVHIIGDATDAVTGKHREDDNLPASLITTMRLDRFDTLLDAATTDYGNGQKLDLGLYVQLTDNIRAQMGALDADSNKDFGDIVAKYREAAPINLGP
jgi:hypothetical protein